MHETSLLIRVWDLPGREWIAPPRGYVHSCPREGPKRIRAQRGAGLPDVVMLSRFTPHIEPGINSAPLNLVSRSFTDVESGETGADVPHPELLYTSLYGLRVKI